MKWFAVQLALVLVSLVAPTAGQRPFKLARCAVTGLPAQLGWRILNKTVDGLTGSNLLGTHLAGSVGNAMNCPGESDCHSWGASFTDRNGLFRLLPSTAASDRAAFTVHSWPDTPSVPVGPGQAPPGQCIQAGKGGDEIFQRPVSHGCLQFVLAVTGQLQVVGSAAFAGFCLDAHPPNWSPPAPAPLPPAPSPEPAGAARLTPCGRRTGVAQQWRLDRGALQLNNEAGAAASACLDFGTADGKRPTLKPCSPGARSQAVQSLSNADGTLLLAAAAFNMSVRQGSTPQVLPNISALCLVADGTFVALATCSALSQFQKWTHEPNGTLAIGSRLCLSAHVPVRQGIPVQLDVHAGSGEARPFRHWWKTAVGSGHAALTLRSDWRAHMAMARRSCGFESVRFHGVFMDDMISVRPTNNDWTQYEIGYVNIDKTYDYLVDLGMKPLVELSFLPQVIANCTRNSDPWNAPLGAPMCGGWFKYGAINGPWRTDVNQSNTVFERWQGLVKDFATHLVSRYGIEEVATWDFELWNEMWGIGIDTAPGLANNDYMTLYAFTAKALKSVSPRLRIGGPTMYLNTPRAPTALVPTNNDYVKDFASRCKAAGLPSDFISIHMYPDDVTCAGQSADGTPHNYGSMCWSQLLEKYRAEVTTILGPNAQLYCTEYSGGLFQNTYDHAYVAAFMFHNAPLLEWISLNSFWAVSDVFEEGGIRSREFTNQYGMISINGIPKPSFRAFELLATAGNYSLPTSITDDAALGTVSAFATTSNAQNQHSTLQVFLSNFSPKGNGDSLVLPCFTQNVTVRVPVGAETWHPSTVRAYRIDEHHANPAEMWMAMGSPEYMNRTQLAVLMAASANVGGSALELTEQGSVVEVTVEVPANGVVVLKDWA